MDVHSIIRVFIAFALTLVAATLSTPSAWATSPDSEPRADSGDLSEPAAGSDLESAATQPDAASGDDFSDMSLEELMAVQVTTVSSVAGVSTPLLATPAAVTVLTAEDIRRAGHRSVAEALRMVPGLQVARISSNRWAITSRGFNSEFSNKLLVMIDGRTVYSPLFSGVYWDIQNVVLEDIERIEVIRGPGATLWGANAVNGVINIVTRSAKDTQGLLFEGGAGDEERGFSTLRYGLKLNEDTYLRAYGMYFNRDGSWDSFDRRQSDNWDMSQGGFRLDWLPESQYSMTLQGDFYGSQHIGMQTSVPILVPPFEKHVDRDTRVDGGNLLARLQRDMSDDEGWSLQLYFDRARRSAAVLDQDIQTFDMDFRHRFPLGDRHRMLWGLGFRYSRSHTEGTPTLVFDPATRGIETISWFIQDTITLVPDTLSLMLGSKFECNDFTGFEFQPSARLMWTPHPKHAVWAAVSRAVRTPSLVEDDIDITLAVVPAPLPTPIRFVGDRNVKSEDLLAYELGYRFKPTDRLSFDLAAFFNDYNDLTSSTSRAGDPFTQFVANDQVARTYGVEFESTWQVTDQWKLAGAYSFLKMDVDGPDTSAQGTSPEHQFNLRSMFDITDDLEFNAGVYYVDHLQATGVPSYVRVDVGLTWRPKPHLELSVWGQNIFDDRHPEFIDPFELPGRPLEVGRGVFAAFKVEF